MTRGFDSILSPEQLAEYIRMFPERLRCWRSGRDYLVPMLDWINTKAATDLRELFSEFGLAALRAHSILHNQSGISTLWALRHLSGTEVRDPGEGAKQSMWDLARRQWTLTNLLAEVRVGARGFEVRHGTIWFTFIGDRNLDALDRLLEVLTEIRGARVDGRPHNGEMVPWLDSGGKNITWNDCPEFVKSHFRTVARALVESYPKYLPDTLDVGGFTIGEATEVLIELVAAAQHGQSCVMRGSVNLTVRTPTYRAEELVAALATKTGVDEQRVSVLIETLTMQTDSTIDPCLTPIVRIGEALVPMSSLIAPGSPVRNLTIVLQQDAARFGEAGRALGRLGVMQCEETLRRLGGCRVATNVDLISDGRRVGDLDVVVIDEAQRLAAIFEVTWQIAPDGSAEVTKAIGKGVGKREQVASNRKRVEGGSAQMRLPPSWPDISGYSKRWFVLTRDVLPLEAPEDEIVIRSHQMLSMMLAKGATITKLIELLDNPPPPPEPLTEMVETQFQYGDVRVAWNQVQA